MRFAALRSRAALFALAAALAVSARGISPAETHAGALWSIDFDAVSIEEAFDKLTQITGIRIFATAPLAYRISPKRYMNRSIEQILKDMLKKVNYAAVWHYSEKGIESIAILAFDRQKAEVPGAAVSGVKRTGTTARSIPRSPGYLQLHSSGTVVGSEREVSAEEPPDEGEETEGGEIDERDEASVTSPREDDDVSNRAQSDPVAEPATGSSNEEEIPAGDRQSESEESGKSSSADREHVRMR